MSSLNSDRSHDQEMSAPSSAEARAKRHLSHALVELQRFRWWPFTTQSAILLDISMGGFKAEVTGRVSALAGQRMWFKVPLSPWGIFSPKRLVVGAEIRWVDPQRSRLGGTFNEMREDERRVLEQLIGVLTSRGERL